MLKLLTQRDIHICDPMDRQIDIDKLTYGRKWAILTALWHSRRETSPRIKGATARAESLADLSHGVGATFIGSLLAWAVTLLIHFCGGESGSSPSFLFWLLPCAMAILHGLAFWRVCRIQQDYVWLILKEELASSRRTGVAAIRRRAYEIWQHNGGPVGTENQDWNRAEAELSDETAQLTHRVVVPD